MYVCSTTIKRKWVVTRAALPTIKQHVQVFVECTYGQRNHKSMIDVSSAQEPREKKQMSNQKMSGSFERPS